jgi:hypothetical protein
MADREGGRTVNEMNSCTVVIEFNYSSKPDKSLGSVWICNGDGTADLAQDSPLSTFPNWVRIVGPIDYEEAEAVHAALKRFFEESGVSVIAD